VSKPAHAASGTPGLRLLPLSLTFLALVSGIAAGLIRIGWDLPAPSPDLPLLHGPLMVSGFFGGLIGLERAVAFGRGWAFAGPLAAGLATLLSLAGVAWPLSEALWAFAALVLAAVSAAIAFRHPALFTVALAVAAAAWLVGNLLWLAGKDVPDLVLWWVAFLVLTIAAERQEMSRVMPPARLSRTLFALPAGLLLAAAALGSTGSEAAGGEAAGRLAGAALLGLTAWLLRHDVARRTVKGSSLPRFSAVCLLSGYVWLAVAGAVGLFGLESPFAYDAFLHSVFVGFVFAMVLGHAPIILPAVARIPVPFRPMFYAPLFLLHLSLALRLVGDFGELLWLRQWSGMLTAGALVLFLIVAGAAARRGA
jgi:hypothetical protein